MLGSGVECRNELFTTSGGRMQERTFHMLRGKDAGKNFSHA
jgi:hypothetical protein